MPRRPYDRCLGPQTTARAGAGYPRVHVYPIVQPMRDRPRTRYLIRCHSSDKRAEIISGPRRPTDAQRGQRDTTPRPGCDEGKGNARESQSDKRWTRTTSVADIVSNIVSPPQRRRAGTTVGATERTDLAPHPRPTIDPRCLGTDHGGRFRARCLCALVGPRGGGCVRLLHLHRRLPVGGLDNACLDGVVISGTSITSGRASCAVTTAVARTSAALVLLGCCPRRFGWLVLGLVKSGGSSGSGHGGRGRRPAALVLSLSLGLEGARGYRLLRVGMRSRLQC